LLQESAGFLVVLAVFKTVVVPLRAGRGRFDSYPLRFGLLVFFLHVGSGEAGELKSRTFLFTYAATITGLPPGGMARVWIPVPPSDGEQTVKIAGRDFPVEPRFGQEATNGNGMFYFHVVAPRNGTIPLGVTYRVTRHESAGQRCRDSASVDRYLKADALVPVGGKPLLLLKERALPGDSVELARVLYDVVDDYLEYRKDKPGYGRGDVGWACDSRFGNCTDFHSLFISLCRCERLPAKFEIGFGLPEARGSGTVQGYHCWAYFLRSEKGGWVPVDISEANRHPAKRAYFFGHVCENRVAFSTGRDLVLVPKQDGPPLNFFIYPYVEVAGKPWPRERIATTFSYSDVDDDAVH